MPSSPTKRLWPWLLVGLAIVILGASLWWKLRGRGRVVASESGSSPAAAAATPAEPSRAPASDPAATVRAGLEQARGLSDPRARARAFGTLLQGWAETDPEAALAYLRRMPRGAEFSLGLRIVLHALATRDIERALRLAAELAGTREDRAIYSELFSRMAQADAATAIQRLALVPSGEGRANALRAVADAWARSDPAAALAWARSLPDEDRPPAMETVLRELTEREPARAIELAQQTLSGPALERTVFEALRRLAAADPREAAGLVRLLPPGEMQTLVAVDVAGSLAGQDVGAALAWVDTLPAGPAQSLALNQVIAHWARRDPAGAGRHVAALPPGPLQEGAALQLGAIWGAEPAAALAWSGTLPEGKTRRDAVAAIVSGWAQREPEAATRWTAAQPAGAVSSAAFEGALSYWILQDAPAVREFVRELAGDVQVRAATAIAPALAQKDPLATLAWAESLPLPPARDAARAAAFARWRGNAPAAADAWLGTANLPAETKAKLRSQ